MSIAVRQAPPVSVVCRGRGWRIAQTLLGALAAASIATWGLQRAGLFDALVLTGLAVLSALAMGLLVWRLLRTEPATLRWNGQQWTLGADPSGPTLMAPVSVAVMLDVASVLLLRASEPQGSVRWVAASRSDAGASWHALRVAAYARPRAAA